MLLLLSNVAVVDSCCCLSLVGLNFWRWRFFQTPDSSLALVDLKMSLVMEGEHVHMMMAMFELRSLKIPNTRWFFRCETEHTRIRDMCH